MSEFWNWKPTPIELKLKDGRSRAAAEQMAGYRPFEADPSHFEATPQVLAQEQMQGYTPALAGYSLPNGPVQQREQQLQGGVRLPQDAQAELGKGWIYTQQQQQVQALKDEYQRNAARIAEIENELASISKSERGRLDDLDMKLAQNRSEIGDIGNAQMHLSRIDQRRAAELGKSGNAAEDRNAAEDEIDRLYIQRGDASPAQQVYIDRAIARKEAAYQKLYGKPYGGKLEVPTGAQAASEVSTFQGYDDVLQQELNANGNNGRLSKAQIANLNAILDKLPSGNERNERKKALDAVVSNEKHAEDAAKQKAKEKDAIAEVKKSVTGWDLKETGASKTVTAKNGQTVTVTRMSDGNVQYKCGSTKG